MPIGGTRGGSRRGMNVFLLGLLRGLSKRGIATDVSPRHGGNRRGRRPVPRGSWVFHVPCGWVDPPSRESAYASSISSSNGAGSLMRGGGIEPGVVSAHYWMSGVVRAKARRRPMVLCFHTVEARKVPGARGRQQPLSSIRRAREAALAREASASSASRSTTSRRTGESFRSCRRRGGHPAGGGRPVRRLPPAWSRGRTLDFPRKG